MSKFCGNCGTELQDDAVQCYNCGFNVAPPQQTDNNSNDLTPGEKIANFTKDTAVWLFGKMKSDKKLTGIVLGAVVGVIAVIVALCLIFGGGYETAIDKYVDAMYYADVDAFFDSQPDILVQKELDDLGLSESKYKDQLESLLEITHKTVIATYGEDFDIDYEVTYEKEVEGDDFEELLDELKDEGVPKKSVSKAYKIEVEFSIDGDKKDDTLDREFVVAKIDGDWFIVDGN